MNFKLDNQTQNDLGIFHAENGKSVFDLFNVCVSLGGKMLLSDIMSEPSGNRQYLKDRIDTIAYFHAYPEVVSKLNIDKNSLDFIEHYLSYYDYPTRKPNKFRAVEKAILYRIAPNNHYYIIERGIDYTLALMNTIYEFFTALDETAIPNFLKETRDKVLSIFGIEAFHRMLAIKEMRKLKAVEIANFDYIFRYVHVLKVRYLIDLIYYLDVVVAAGKVAEKYRFSYPEIISSTENKIEACEKLCWK